MSETKKKSAAVMVSEQHGIKNYKPEKPQELVIMAKVIQSFVKEQKLATVIGGKNYVQVEGWQLAGTMIGWTPTIVEEENLSQGTEFKWKVTVELRRLQDDKVIGRASALCSNKEAKKKTFDEYAILSMAQTRAIGKVYRNTLGWVMKAAGYETTPMEEVPSEPKEPITDLGKALDKISKVKTTKTLDAIQVKLNTSDKYDEEDAQTIQEAIDQKRKELTD